MKYLLYFIPGKCVRGLLVIFLDIFSFSIVRGYMNIRFISFVFKFIFLQHCYFVGKLSVFLFININKSKIKLKQKRNKFTY